MLQTDVRFLGQGQVELTLRMTLPIPAGYPETGGPIFDESRPAALDQIAAQLPEALLEILFARQEYARLRAAGRLPADAPVQHTRTRGGHLAYGPPRETVADSAPASRVSASDGGNIERGYRRLAAALGQRRG